MELKRRIICFNNSDINCLYLLCCKYLIISIECQSKIRFFQGNLHVFFVASSHFRRSVKDRIIFCRRENLINPTLNRQTHRSEINLFFFFLSKHTKKNVIRKNEQVTKKTPFLSSFRNGFHNNRPFKC